MPAKAEGSKELDLRTDYPWCVEKKYLISLQNSLCGYPKVLEHVPLPSTCTTRTRTLITTGFSTCMPSPWGPCRWSLQCARGHTSAPAGNRKGGLVKVLGTRRRRREGSVEEDLSAPKHQDDATGVMFAPSLTCDSPSPALAFPSPRDGLFKRAPARC